MSGPTAASDWIPIYTKRAKFALVFWALGPAKDRKCGDQDRIYCRFWSPSKDWSSSPSLTTTKPVMRSSVEVSRLGKTRDFTMKWFFWKCCRYVDFSNSSIWGFFIFYFLIDFCTNIQQAMSNLAQRPQELWSREIAEFLERESWLLVARYQTWMLLSENASIGNGSAENAPVFPLLPASRGFCLTLNKSLQTFERIVGVTLKKRGPSLDSPDPALNVSHESNLSRWIIF